MSKIIGLIGKIASGKTVVADYLINDKKAGYHRFSDVLRDVLERLHQPNVRENLQKLGVALRGVFGDGLLAEILKRDILADKSEIVVVDGIRYQDEFDMVKGLGGIILYVTVPDRTRYERVVSRATRGEAGLSFEKFLENESSKTESLIDELGSKADHILENTGTLEDLKARVEEIIG